MRTYTSQQLLTEFRRRLFLEPLRDDCVIERTDGVDIDTQLMAEINQWYARLIDTAPAHWLSTENLAPLVVAEPVPAAGAVTIALPEDTRRVVSLTIKGNPTPVIPVTDPASPLLALQSSPFTRGGQNRPVAFLSSPLSITLFADDAQGNPPILTSLIGVRLTPGIYQFDDRAWETVPEIKI